MRKKKTLLIGILLVSIMVMIAFSISNYLKSQPKLVYAINPNPQDIISYPETRFAVMSDLHYYDVSLGTSGSAFEAHILTDRKLFRESAELLDLAISEILSSTAEFVLIPGDMTKDGELICHEQVVQALRKLLQGGKKVYVVPGNHDVNILHGAVKFEGDTTVPVETVSAEKFAELYRDFGYGGALFRDENSLSYVAEPTEGLWLIGLDACRYRENTVDEEMVGGKLQQSTLDWLEGVLKKADEQQKEVIAMMHHGVVEHWEGQSKLHPDYLVEEYQHIGKFMASYGVRLVFTGHYHAQDITRADFGDAGYIYDIQTGSMVTPPCPIRFCTLSAQEIDLQSVNLVGKFRPGTDFEVESDKFVAKTIELEAFKVLRGYYVPEGDAQKTAEFVTKAFMAHYLGDEDQNQRPPFDVKQLGLWSRFIYSQQKYVVEGLWQDLHPADVNVILDLGLR